MAPCVVIVLASAVFAAALTAVDGAAADSRSEDAAGIQGTWVCAAAVVDGKSLDENTTAKLRLVMTAERYRTERGDDQVLFDSTYRLDPRQDPRQIEMTGTEGDAAGKQALGIYSLEGDTLKICYTMPGGQRPKSFESKPGSKAFLVTWTRVRK